MITVEKWFLVVYSLQPPEDISCIAWNRQVQHILASASPSGRATVWDLRKNEPIIKVSDHNNRVSSNLHIVTHSNTINLRKQIYLWETCFVSAIAIPTLFVRVGNKSDFCIVKSCFLMDQSCWNERLFFPLGKIIKFLLNHTGYINDEEKDWSVKGVIPWYTNCFALPTIPKHYSN